MGAGPRTPRGTGGGGWPRRTEVEKRSEKKTTESKEETRRMTGDRKEWRRHPGG